MRKKLAALFILIGLALAGWSGFAWANESSSGESIGENDIIVAEDENNEADEIHETNEENNISDNTGTLAEQNNSNDNISTPVEQNNSNDNNEAVREHNNMNESPESAQEESNTAQESIPAGNNEEENAEPVPAQEEIDPADFEEPEPRDYEEYATGDEVGWLLIPSIDMKYPVYWGTDDDTLKQGVGYHEGDFTVPPDGLRHTVLSGHRDTVFQELGDLEEGESMYIQFEDVQYEYEIQKTWITDAEDRTVIVNKDEPVLTLTTCYPFSFLGAAPDRYIIEAPLVDTTEMN